MASTMRPRPKLKAKADEVGVMFRATQQVRGSIKSVSAWCEMNDVRIEGKVPIEKDIWAWIAASFYMAGRDKHERATGERTMTTTEIIIVVAAFLFYHLVLKRGRNY